MKAGKDAAEANAATLTATVASMTAEKTALDAKVTQLTTDLAAAKAAQSGGQAPTFEGGEQFSASGNAIIFGQEVAVPGAEKK